ncbi:unnamed protein product [Rhodiola kirilowii]
MADLLTNSNGARLETAIWTAKLMLLSIGTVSTFLLFKVAVIPCLFDFALSVVPWSLSCFRTWLSPPYIYIIVNFIIISIAASSSFQPHSKLPVAEKVSGGDEEEESVAVELAKSESNDVIEQDVVSFFSTDADAVVSGEFSDDSDETEVVVVKHELTMSSTDAFSYLENSPPEDEDGDSYDDSLDGTWKAIMEGKGTVKKPLLKKSDTWNATDTRAPPPQPLAEVSNYVSSSYRPEMRKSETFNDRVSTLRTGGGLRREALLPSHDSLNERVEAFINKFNNDMRIERQQSDMRYINMVKQAAAT